MHCVIKWQNGDSWDGHWNDGNRNGTGTKTYANGAKFTGVWIDGKREGIGIKTHANGNKIAVSYERGVRT
jgi:hypothetical protein